MAFDKEDNLDNSILKKYHIKSITKTWYFWTSILLPLSLMIFSSIIIYNSCYALDWNLTKTGLENFMRIFEIPLSLLGVMLVLIGAAFTYYRSKLSFLQFEKLKEQEDRAQRQFLIYQDQFRQSQFEFKEKQFLDDLNIYSKDEFQSIAVPKRSLFKLLFTQDKEGGIILRPEIERNLKKYWKGLIKELENRIEDKHYNIYSCVNYEGIVSYLRIINLSLSLEFSPAINQSLKKLDLEIYYDKMFGGHYMSSNHYKAIPDLVRDTLKITKSVNAFLGKKVISTSGIDKIESILSYLVADTNRILAFYSYMQNDFKRIIETKMESFKQDLLIDSNPDATMILSFLEDNLDGLQTDIRLDSVALDLIFQEVESILSLDDGNRPYLILDQIKEVFEKQKKKVPAF